MTAPKYKVKQWVIVNDSNRPLQICNIMKEYGIGRILYSFEDYDPVYDESEILYAVKIYPDYGEVYCKDCKHSQACPLRTWVETTYIIHDCYGFDRPPPNCHCFEPKLSTNPQFSSNDDKCKDKSLFAINHVESANNETEAK